MTRDPDCVCRWQDVQLGNEMDALVAGAEAAPDAPLPASDLIDALVSAPSAPQSLYAALPSGMWALHSAGVVWSRATGGRTSALSVHPTDPEQFVAVIDDGLMQRHVGGLTWTALAAK